MTTGQLMFYGGIALLVLTILLAIIFIIIKPKYVPESSAYDGSDASRTQQLRSGYPTDRLTIRRESVIPGSALLDSTPAAPVQQATELLPTEECSEQGTEPLTSMEHSGQEENPPSKISSESTSLLTEVLGHDEQEGTLPLD